jgi:hypothetical protein
MGLHMAGNKYAVDPRGFVSEAPGPALCTYLPSSPPPSNTPPPTHTHTHTQIHTRPLPAPVPLLPRSVVLAVRMGLSPADAGPNSGNVFTRVLGRPTIRDGDSWKSGRYAGWRQLPTSASASALSSLLLSCRHSDVQPCPPPLVPSPPPPTFVYSNCWICEAWREVEFRYTPLSSGPAASRVSLQVSFDGWKSDVMDYCPPDEGVKMDHGQYTTGYFVLFRMVPPGT